MSKNFLKFTSKSRTAVIVLLISLAIHINCEELIEETGIATETPDIPPFDPTLVTVAQGQIRGNKEIASYGKEFYSFRGIPYAKSPVDDLRFEPPQDAEGWQGVLVAEKDPPACPQLDMMAMLAEGRINYIGDEDCLFLNVFSPMPNENDSSLLPVMVFIHGGGYICGRASEYQPYALMSKDIVLVVIQYRLSTLGFLSTEDDVAPGNMGILDQIAALSWVQRNAPSFKGNPLQITIFGESAGGASVHLQMLSHASLGFFHRAIIQSGTAISSWAVAPNHREVAYHMAKLLDCGTSSNIEPKMNCTLDENDPFLYESCLVDQLPSSAVIKCLKAAPAQLLVELSSVFWQVGSFPLMMAPRVDENLLMKDPLQLVKEHRSKKIDIMLGVTKDEGSIWSKSIFLNEALRSKLRFQFTGAAPVLLDLGEGDVAPLNLTIKLFDRYVGNADFEIGSLDNLTALLGDRLMWYPSDSLAHYLASDPVSPRRGKKLFVYEFAYLSKTRGDSIYDKGIKKRYVHHTEDLIYLFSGPSDHPWLGPALTSAEDLEMRDLMVDMWTNFAITGNPTPDGHPVEWRPYTPDAPHHLVIDQIPAMDESDPKKELREFWRQLPLRMNLVLFPDSVTNLTEVVTESVDSPNTTETATLQMAPASNEQETEVVTENFESSITKETETLRKVQESNDQEPTEVVTENFESSITKETETLQKVPASNDQETEVVTENIESSITTKNDTPQTVPASNDQEPTEAPSEKPDDELARHEESKAEKTRDEL
ncbi:esterase E4-like isoform X2 [Hyalella azteca]|uniref:Esterase E4-like isoform X2 n=1 Tax=Hyalella azteca TaxID=294128 RepID=A0A979FIF8_HYAAZ|nr:esterase E4-like isoform X2 [Hyalella azteca]